MGLQPPSSSRRGHTRNTASRRHAPNPNPPGGTLRNSANTSPYPPPPLPRDLQPLARCTEPKAALTPETRATTCQQMSRSLRPPARQGTLGWRILSREIILSTPVLFPVKGGAARGLVERPIPADTAPHTAWHSPALPVAKHPGCHHRAGLSPIPKQRALGSPKAGSQPNSISRDRDSREQAAKAAAFR